MLDLQNGNGVLRDRGRHAVSLPPGSGLRQSHPAGLTRHGHFMQLNAVIEHGLQGRVRGGGVLRPAVQRRGLDQNPTRHALSLDI